LAAALKEEAGTRDTYWPGGFYQWTPLGHRIAAERLAKIVLDHNLFFQGTGASPDNSEK